MTSLHLKYWFAYDKKICNSGSIWNNIKFIFCECELLREAAIRTTINENGPYNYEEVRFSTKGTYQQPGAKTASQASREKASSWPAAIRSASVEICLMYACSFLGLSVRRFCSTSLPGGNQVDGLPPVRHSYRGTGPANFYVLWHCKYNIN